MYPAAWQRPSNHAVMSQQWSLEAVRFLFRIVQSLWNLTGTSACQISKRYDHLNYQYRSFETPRDLTIRRLIGYWNGPWFLHVGEHFVLQGTMITWTSHERHGVSNHPTLLFVQQLVQANNKENINVLHHRPFLGEFTGNRLIPLTKG